MLTALTQEREGKIQFGDPRVCIAWNDGRVMEVMSRNVNLALTGRSGLLLAAARGIEPQSMVRDLLPSGIRFLEIVRQDVNQMAEGFDLKGSFIRLLYDPREVLGDLTSLADEAFPYRQGGVESLSPGQRLEVGLDKLQRALKGWSEQDRFIPQAVVMKGISRVHDPFSLFVDKYIVYSQKYFK